MGKKNERNPKSFRGQLRNLRVGEQILLSCEDHYDVLSKKASVYQVSKLLEPEGVKLVVKEQGLLLSITKVRRDGHER